MSLAEYDVNNREGLAFGPFRWSGSTAQKVRARCSWKIKNVRRLHAFFSFHNLLHFLFVVIDVHFLLWDG
jgi:hypothetical protein